MKPYKIKIFEARIETVCGGEDNGRISVEFVDEKPECVVHVHSLDGMTLYTYDSSAKAENLVGISGGYFFKDSNNELILVSDDFTMVFEQ